MSNTHYDVIVIGAGIAGLSAAKHALETGLSTAIIEPAMFGGLVTNINELQGAVQGSGADFATQLMDDISGLGAEILMTQVASIESNGDSFAVTTGDGAQRARSVIVASGARLKRLSIPGEERFEGRGLSHCADCDGPMFAGQDVAVVGGGDSALQEALILAKRCRQIHLLHRGDSFRANKELRDAVVANVRITVHWHTAVEEIRGTVGVESLSVVNVRDDSRTELVCKGIFPFIGLEPASGFVPSGVARTGSGLLQTNGFLETAVKGVFAAGAVRSGYGGTLSDAISDGRTAATSAHSHLSA
jgi:thioredoxin reductase (NADPH)